MSHSNVTKMYDNNYVAHWQSHLFACTNQLLARCHSKQCADQLANFQTQHKNDESQHKPGETIDLQQQFDI